MCLSVRRVVLRMLRVRFVGDDDDDVVVVVLMVIARVLLVGVMLLFGMWWIVSCLHRLRPWRF